MCVCFFCLWVRKGWGLSWNEHTPLMFPGCQKELIYWDCRHSVHVCISDCSVLELGNEHLQPSEQLIFKKKISNAQAPRVCLLTFVEYRIHYSSEILLCSMYTELSICAWLSLLSRYGKSTSLTPSLMLIHGQEAIGRENKASLAHFLF